MSRHRAITQKLCRLRFKSLPRRLVLEGIAYTIAIAIDVHEIGSKNAPQKQQTNFQRFSIAVTSLAGDKKLWIRMVTCVKFKRLLLQQHCNGIIYCWIQNVSV